MSGLDFTEPNVCIGENLTTDDAGLLRLQDYAVPRPVIDVKADANDGTGKIYPTLVLPGKLLINQQASWKNNTPLEQDAMIRVVRGPREIVTSNPNAIQFRDRWSYARDATPEPPVTSGYYNSQNGVAVDLNTNSVAEPNPGRFWLWSPVSCVDEWVPYTIAPGETFNLWYRCYVWTPPPWSDNANKNSPLHTARANYTRIQLWAFGRQGTVVTG